MAVENLNTDTLRSWLTSGQPVSVSDVRPTTQSVEGYAIVERNSTGSRNEEEAIELEAGANRCAT
jgi:hypothetical protein